MSGKGAAKKFFRNQELRLSEPLDTALLRMLVSRIEELLPLPAVVNEILKTVNDPYASLARLSQVILRDPALTAKILKVINSAFYGLPVRVTTVSQAVALLGLEKIKNLAMAISLTEALSHWPGLPGLSRDTLWIHAQACAVATRLLAEQSGYHLPEEALIVGLLHDVAKVLWTELFPERYSLALQEIRQQGVEPLQAETKYLTVTHPVLGSWLLRQWRLPPIMPEVIAHHHNPRPTQKVVRNPTGHLTVCLALGNLLAKLLNLGDGGNYRLSGFAWALVVSLGLERVQLVDLIRRLPQTLEEFTGQLELERGSGPLHRQKWMSFQKYLAGLNLLLIFGQDREQTPGLVGLLCQALGQRWETLSLNELKERPGAVGKGGAVLIETSHPEAVLADLRSWTTLPARLIVFSHTPWPVNLPGHPHPPKFRCLGPELHLEEFISALTGKIT